MTIYEAKEVCKGGYRLLQRNMQCNTKRALHQCRRGARTTAHVPTHICFRDARERIAQSAKEHAKEWIVTTNCGL